MAKWQVAAAAVGVLAIGLTGCGALRPQAGASRPASTARARTGSGAFRTAAAAPTTPHAATPDVPASGPVPAGFAATSVTFVSPREAFVLGTAPCAASPCTSIVRTLNRGASWRGLPAPLTPLASPYTGRPGVWGIRFGTPAHGFAFGKGLWETTDGGEHWVQDPWRHGSIISLAVLDGQVLALTARCTSSNGCGHTADLLRRPLAGGAWRSVASLSTPDVFYLGDAIATMGRVAAMVDGSRVLVTADGGFTFHRNTTPCSSVRAGMATSVAVTSARGLALLCTGEGFMGHTVKRVYVSRDDGASWTRAGSPSDVGDGGMLSAADPMHLAIATTSAASWLYTSVDGGGSWAIARTQLDGGLSWADLGFTTTTDGVVVRGPADADGNTNHHPGWLLLTNDAGAHWRRVRF